MVIVLERVLWVNVGADDSFRFMLPRHYPGFEECLQTSAVEGNRKLAMRAKALDFASTVLCPIGDLLADFAVEPCPQQRRKPGILIKDELVGLPALQI